MTRWINFGHKWVNFNWMA